MNRIFALKKITDLYSKWLVLNTYIYTHIHFIGYHMPYKQTRTIVTHLCSGSNVMVFFFSYKISRRISKLFLLYDLKDNQKTH